MRNIDLSHPCKTEEIELFGQKIPVKGYICSENGGPYREKPKDKKIQLTICPTSFCAAKCPFCLAVNTPDKVFIDTEKLRETLEYLEEANVVRGVSVTGGEPFTDVGVLNEVLNMTFDILGKDTEVSLNTNSMYIDRFRDIEAIDLLESIHVSRHHYDDNINNELFGNTKMPGKEALSEVIKSFPYDDLFVLNCMMAKGYIDSTGEICRYLDFVAETGAYKASFITATVVNEYTGKRVVDYRDVFDENDKRFLFTRRYQDYEWCRCRDGIYLSSSGMPVEFYGRRSSPGGCDYARGLVIHTDNTVTVGFNGKRLV